MKNISLQLLCDIIAKFMRFFYSNNKYFNICSHECLTMNQHYQWQAQIPIRLHFKTNKKLSMLYSYMLTIILKTSQLCLQWLLPAFLYSWAIAVRIHRNSCFWHWPLRCKQNTVQCTPSSTLIKQLFNIGYFFFRGVDGTLDALHVTPCYLLILNYLSCPSWILNRSRIFQKGYSFNWRSLLNFKQTT